VFAGDLASAQAPVGRVDPVGAFYLRVRLKDRTGAIAALAATLARHGVSIDSLVQKPVSDATGAPVVLTTHPVPDSVVRAAAADLAGNDMVVDGPCVMWIEDDPG
jgi:homoserine dehydrogenase